MTTSAFGVEHITKAYGRGPAMDAARWTVGLGTTSAAGGGAIYGNERMGKRPRKKSDAADIAVAGAAGGAAGQGVYQAAGYEAKHRAMRTEAKSGQTKNQKDKKLKPAKKMFGAHTAGMYRNYPKDMPGARIHRTLGYTHRGKIGTAVGAAATLGASAAAIAAARKSKEKS